MRRSLLLSLLVCAGCRDQAAYDAVVARHRGPIDELMAAIRALPAVDAKSVHARGEVAAPTLAEPLELPLAPPLRFMSLTTRPNLAVFYRSVPGDLGGLFSDCVQLLHPERFYEQDLERWRKSKPDHWDGVLESCHVRYVAIAAIDSGCEEFAAGDSKTVLCGKGVYELWDMVERKRISSGGFTVPLPVNVAARDVSRVQEELMISGARGAVRQLARPN